MNIKIYVASHQNHIIPKYESIIPIQVGSALAKELYPQFIYDNTGFNISEKNKQYCELTAQYWAWKNEFADYYGFFHYRRYLYPEPYAKKPYVIRSCAVPELLDKMHFSELRKLISGYDIILPKKENMWLSVEEHYASAKHHHEKDLRHMMSILVSLHPEYEEAMKTYLTQTNCYFGNIFIMKKEVFHHYCQWLFTLLFLFEEQADLTLYGEEEMRVMGYLGERLLGIYYTFWHRKYMCLELPRVHFEQNRYRRAKVNLTNYILPASSKRRFIFKNAPRKIKEKYCMDKG